MAFRLPSIKALLSHFAVGILGAFTFAILAFCMITDRSREIAMIKCYEAGQRSKVGNDDEAIFLLGQASGADKTYYEPFNLVAKVYLQKGNKELALKAYRKASEILDIRGDADLQSNDLAWTKEQIRKNIDDLEKQVNTNHAIQRN